MIQIFKTAADGTLAPQKRVTQGVWINAVAPTADEIEQLIAWGAPEEAITSALDIDELARVEREDGATYIILRAPYYDGHQEDIPYSSVPLGIITTSKWIMTVSKYSTELLRESRKSKEYPLHTRKHNTFILHILFNTAKLFLKYLIAINRVVDGLEDRLTVSINNKDLFRLLKYQKSLVYFSTALKTNEVMIERLQRMQLFQRFEEDQELLDDVLTETMQALEMNNISSNILNQMMDAFASMISNNQNDVVKVLTSVTLVLGLPTLVASFYGMNVLLPLADDPMAFWFTVGISLVLMVIAVVIIRLRGWF
ncbi:MAG: magnesium transporter CorA family protein [Anaerolineales bacterium]|nr:magnesium transporter CorA family protein [Anaerolineales bacterium]